jgi:hypothetical protein
LPHRRREQYDDRWVTMIYLRSVVHHRPARWACDARNWRAAAAAMDARPLISQSRLSRRLRTLGVNQLVERALAAMSDLLLAAEETSASSSPPPPSPPLVKLMDSKPLTVGAYSKDVDARRAGWPTGSSPAATGATRSRTVGSCGTGRCCR